MARQYYSLPDDQCERLNRKQMGDMMRLYTLLSDSAHSQEDMKSRLQAIPNGEKRMRLALGQIRAIVDDITGTIPVEQCRRIMNTMTDYVSALVPKYTPSNGNILLPKEQGKKLIDFARIKCRECADDNEQCRKCELYNLLTAVVPCDDYGETFLCPYSMSEWE